MVTLVMTTTSKAMIGKHGKRGQHVIFPVELVNDSGWPFKTGQDVNIRVDQVTRSVIIEEL